MEATCYLYERGSFAWTMSTEAAAILINDADDAPTTESKQARLIIRFRGWKISGPKNLLAQDALQELRDQGARI